MAGLNIPKRKRMTTGELYRKATSAGDKVYKVASLGGQMLFGEDTGDGMAKDLAYGAVPGGSLYQRAMTGTKPGMLDYLDVVPGVGTVGGLSKAASLAVLPDLVKLIGKRYKSPSFETKFEKLPEAVRESWLASFGDLYSKKLATQRRQSNPRGSSDFERDVGDVGLMIKHPTLKWLDEADGDASGYYIPMGYSLSTESVYHPQIKVKDYGRGSDQSSTIIHEGAHLMDEVLGTARHHQRTSDAYPFFYPMPTLLSEEGWMPYIVYGLSPKGGKRAKTPRHPLYDGVPRKDNYSISDYQDITGNFSPIEYEFAKHLKQIDPADYEKSGGGNPYDWLADDPHGLEHFKKGGYGDDGINSRSVATEGLAQFIESIPYLPALKKTRAMKTLSQFAELDPRRKSDYFIDFDPQVRELETAIHKNEFGGFDD